MASNPIDPSTTDDDEYQVQYEDEDDDERTIEEEEQLESDDEQNELDDLQAGADMPLDELLKLYGQNAPPIMHISHKDDESNTSSEDNDRRHQFHHLLHVNGQLLSEDNDDDDDTDDSFEPEIIKVINIGDEYQAQVELQAEYNSESGHSDDREVPIDELLWSPPSPVNEINNENIDEYLKIIHNEYPSVDDEISLKNLFNCQMNTELALIKFRQLPVKTIYSYSEWSFDEIQQFEEGLHEYGKNFFKISKFKCLNRNVREIIHYYYQWKKSERYKIYLEEQQRLNVINSVSDMIEKLIEEQEQQLCTAINSNDLKRNSSISIVTIHQQETTKRTFDQVDNDIELPPSKKPLLNTNNSSTATII